MPSIKILKSLLSHLNKHIAFHGVVGLLFLFQMFSACSERAEIVVTHYVQEEPLGWLRFGEVKPAGWIQEQMVFDMNKGFVGHLSELVPELIQEDDIYGVDRLTRKVKSKELGSIAGEEGPWTVAYLWWNSETQSNFWDGFVRNALLTGNEEKLKEVDAYIKKKLLSQDEDGYMGIYSPDLRFNFDSENGELWAQSSLFRVLLGYYEATGEVKVLTAVERAVGVTMEAYFTEDSRPFDLHEPFGGGVGHGLTLVDALDRLFQLTGKQKYRDFAVWLYDDYNLHKLFEVDIQIDHLNDPSYRFMGHGVHTYEHLRALLIALDATGEEKYKVALDNYLEKLELCLLPSGAPAGDEWIRGRKADANQTGYEYCSLQELMDSYGHLVQKSGELKWGDQMERLFFNAAQGSRHPHESSIAYLKTDNSYSMNGTDPWLGSAHPHNVRYSYSPTHKEAAVCCVPNAGRIHSYFVRNMWMRSETGLVKTLYGPSEVNTLVNDVQVRIFEKTDYPMDDKITYELDPEIDVEFDLLFRKPSWCDEMNISVNGRVVDGNRITKKWQQGDLIEVVFIQGIRKQNDLKGNYYVTRGPLVYALPLESEMTVTKSFPIEEFQNLQYVTKEMHKTRWQISPENISTFTFERVKGSSNHFESGMILGKLFDPDRQEEQEVKLVPIGSTILRKVTFEEKL